MKIDRTLSHFFIMAKMFSLIWHKMCLGPGLGVLQLSTNITQQPEASTKKEQQF